MLKNRWQVGREKSLPSEWTPRTVRKSPSGLPNAKKCSGWKDRFVALTSGCPVPETSDVWARSKFQKVHSETLLYSLTEQVMWIIEC